MLTELPTEWSDAAPRLRLALRRRFTPVNGARAARRGPAFRLVEGPACGPITARVMLHFDDAQVYVQHHHLHAWNVDVASTLSAAMQNTAAHAHQGLTIDREGLLTVQADPEAAARILIPGWLAAVETQLGGPLAVMVPDEGELYIARRDDPELLHTLVTRGLTRFQQATHPLTPAPFALGSGGRCAPFVTDEGPAATRIRAAHAMALAQLYDDQAEVIWDDLDEGAVVAGVTVRVNGLTLQPLTLCRWRPGAPTLLPRTQLVEVETDGETLQLPWDGFEAVLGRRLEVVPGLEPRRLLLVGPLDPEDTQALRERALRLPLVDRSP